MKWSTYDLNWGRPLKSILAIFNKKEINFNFFHLKSGNLTLLGEDSDKNAITTTTCPYSEITWTKVKAEMDKL